MSPKVLLRKTRNSHCTFLQGVECVILLQMTRWKPKEVKSYCAVNPRSQTSWLPLWVSFLCLLTVDFRLQCAPRLLTTQMARPRFGVSHSVSLIQHKDPNLQFMLSSRLCCYCCWPKDPTLRTSVLPYQLFQTPTLWSFSLPIQNPTSKSKVTDGFDASQ